MHGAQSNHSCQECEWNCFAIIEIFHMEQLTNETTLPKHYHQLNRLLNYFLKKLAALILQIFRPLLTDMNRLLALNTKLKRVESNFATLTQPSLVELWLCIRPDDAPYWMEWNGLIRGHPAKLQWRDQTCTTFQYAHTYSTEPSSISLFIFVLIFLTYKCSRVDLNHRWKYKSHLKSREKYLDIFR